MSKKTNQLASEPKVLPFACGGNAACGESEKHDSPKAGASGQASMQGKDRKASPSPELDESRVSGTNHEKTPVQKIRTANAEHRDSRTRQGRQKAATIVSE